MILETYPACKSAVALLTVSFALMLTPVARAQVAAVHGKPRDIPISFITSDSLELHAWLTVTNDTGMAPLLITLPMRGRTHSSYEPFIEKVLDYFAVDRTGRPRPYILSIDLRGHGESRVLKGDTIDYRDMGQKQYRRIPFDIAELARSVMSDSNYAIEANGVIIVGASIGANSSIMAAELIPGTNRVAMLSPGIDYLGLTPETALKETKSEVLILVGNQDSYSFRSSKRLAEMGGKKVTLKALDSVDHGTNIIANSKSAMSELIEWLFRP